MKRQVKRQRRRKRLLKPLKRKPTRSTIYSKKSEAKLADSEQNLRQSKDIAMTDTAQQNIPTTDTAQQNIPTKRRRRRTSAQQNQTKPPRENTSGLDASAAKEVVKDSAPKDIHISFRVSEKRAKKLAENIAGTYATLGVLVASRDQYDGMVLLSGAYDRAGEIVGAASHNKRIFELLERVFTQGDFFKLIVGHGAMVYALLAHHNKVPMNAALLQQFGYTEAQLYAKFAPAQAEQHSDNNTGSTAHIPENELVTR